MDKKECIEALKDLDKMFNLKMKYVGGEITYKEALTYLLTILERVDEERIARLLFYTNNPKADWDIAGYQFQELYNTEAKAIYQSITSEKV